MTDFHFLYVEYAPLVRRLMLLLSGNAALADDITSETFVRAWTTPGPLREETVRRTCSRLRATSIRPGDGRDALPHPVVRQRLTAAPVSHLVLKGGDRRVEVTFRPGPPM